MSDENLNASAFSMVRKVLVFFALLVGVVLTVVAVLLLAASPGPRSQEILGVAIGSYGSEPGIAYMSGRRLTCTALDAAGPFNSRCVVKIAGKPLEIRARRNPPSDPIQFGGACMATYDGEQWPCRVGSRHVQVHWFAYIDDPLGLDQTQLDTLRRQYLVENLPEETFVRGIVAVPFVVTVVIFVLAASRLLRRRTAGAGTLLAVVLVSLFTGAAVFALSLFLTNGFWD